MLSTELREHLRDIGLLVWRTGFAFALFWEHGLPKWQNFNELATDWLDPLGIGPTATLLLAMFAEILCTFLVFVGLATRLAAAAIVINFAVVVFLIKLGEPFGERELAILYLVGSLGVMFAGAGRISLDSAVGFVRRD